jgi:hypothetical protein
VYDSPGLEIPDDLLDDIADLVYLGVELLLTVEKL